MVLLLGDYYENCLDDQRRDCRGQCRAVLPYTHAFSTLHCAYSTWPEAKYRRYAHSIPYDVRQPNPGSKRYFLITLSNNRIDISLAAFPFPFSLYTDAETDGTRINLPSYTSSTMFAIFIAEVIYAQIDLHPGRPSLAMGTIILAFALDKWIFSVK